MSLALTLTQQHGSQARSDPSEGLFQRPKCLFQHHRLTLPQTAMYVCLASKSLKKLLSAVTADPPIAIRKQQNGCLQRRSRAGWTPPPFPSQGQRWTDPGPQQQDAELPLCSLPHSSLQTHIHLTSLDLCALWAAQRRQRFHRHQGERVQLPSRYSLPPSTLATVIYNGRHPISMYPAHGWEG